MARQEEKTRICVLIAAFQEEKRIAEVVGEARKYLPDIIVVDDGSSDGTSVEAEKAGAVVLCHAENRGKGVALETGFSYVREHGFEVVITMDGDGQHSPEDLPNFVDAYHKTGEPIMVGNRMGNTADMPAIRRLTNRFMSWLLSEQMKQRVPDTQCGFRLFRCDAIPEVSKNAAGYEAESEVLLRAAEKGLRIGSVPVQTIYRDETSSIHPVKDTIRFFRMLIRYRRRSRDGRDDAASAPKED